MGSHDNEIHVLIARGIDNPLKRDAMHDGGGGVQSRLLHPRQYLF
jgi:hypothetical protein